MTTAKGADGAIKIRVTTETGVLFSNDGALLAGTVN
jgi:hypothetical protein